MPTHIHLVTMSDHDGASQLRLFKGAASRLLTQCFGAPVGRWWTKSGSTRSLGNERAILDASAYVRRHAALAWVGKEAP